MYLRGWRDGVDLLPHGADLQQGAERSAADRAVVSLKQAVRKMLHKKYEMERTSNSLAIFHKVGHND